jgi:hypothetical protein
LTLLNFKGFPGSISSLCCPADVVAVKSAAFQEERKPAETLEVLLLCSGGSPLFPSLPSHKAAFIKLPFHTEIPVSFNDLYMIM